MPGWNGSGTFERYYDWTDDESAGQNIEAARFDQENDTFASGINNCLTKNGENSPTAALPMGGYSHTGVGEGTARNQYATISQLQDCGQIFNSTGGTANAITLTPAPAITEYVSGVRFIIQATADNTGPATLDISGVGAKDIFFNYAALIGGEIRDQQIYVVVYDGTQFQLVVTGGYLGGCKVVLTSNSTIAHNSATIVTWADQVYDDADYWGAGAPNRLIIPVTGRYRLHWGVSWTLLDDFMAIVGPWVNGGSMLGGVETKEFELQAAFSVPAGHMGSFEHTFTAADYIQLSVQQRDWSGSSSRDLKGSATTNDASWMSIERLR